MHTTIAPANLMRGPTLDQSSSGLEDCTLGLRQEEGSSQSLGHGKSAFRRRLPRSKVREGSCAFLHRQPNYGKAMQCLIGTAMRAMTKTGYRNRCQVCSANLRSALRVSRWLHVVAGQDQNATPSQTVEVDP